GEHVLDLERVDVVATADVHVGAAAGEHEVAAVVEAAEVGTRQPAVGRQHRGGLFRVAPVPAHYARPTDPHAADLAGRNRRPVGADQVDLHAFLWAADRAVLHLGIVAGVGAGDAR